MEFNFTVRGDKIIPDKEYRFVEGNKGCYGAVFDFGDDPIWEEAAKVCIVETGEKVYKIIIAGGGCILPELVRGSMRIGVFGVDTLDGADLTTKISTNMVKMGVDDGAADAKVTAEFSTAAEVWEQYLAEMEKSRKAAEEAKTGAETAAANAAQSEAEAKASANDALLSKEFAANHAKTAETAAENAKNAEVAAQESLYNSGIAERNARSYAESAYTSQINAKASQANAALSREEARTYSTAAEVSADNAAKSAAEAKAAAEKAGNGTVTSNIGKKVAGGGVIFGDLINNMAAAPFTMATGSGCIAGMRGYFYSAIEFGEALGSGTYGPCKITLTKIQPDDINKAASPDAFNIGFAVGDKISVINNLKYPDCATITEIEKNVITVDSLPFNSIVNMSQNSTGTASDDYSVFVAEKPLAGDVPLGYGAFAGGEDAFALERASAAFGRLVKAIGQYGFAANRETIAAYCAAAFGHRSKALGHNSFAINSRTETRASGSLAAGDGTVANTPYQAVFGRFNIVDLLQEYALIVGGGDSKTGLRDNLLTLGWDGDLWSKGDIYFGGSNKSAAQRVIGQSDVYDIIATAFATYTARELVAGITAEIGLRFLYEQDDITTYSVEVDGIEVAEKTPIAEKMRIASELLKAKKTRFVFYAGEEKVYTAAVKNTLPNRGMLFMV